MADSEKTGASGICGFVTIAERKGVVANAEVHLFSESATRTRGKPRRPAGEPVQRTRTDATGRYQFQCEPGAYCVHCEAFGQANSVDQSVTHGEIAEAAVLELDLGFELALFTYGEGDQRNPVSRAVVGQPLIVCFQARNYGEIAKIKWITPLAAHAIESEHEVELVFSEAGKAIVEAIAVADWDAPASTRTEVRMSAALIVSEPATQTIRGNVGVTLHRSASHPTLDQALWAAIRNRTHAISFHRYREFLNRVLRWEEHEKLPEAIERRLRDLGAHRFGVTPWHALKIATEMFLLMECGVRIEHEDRRELESDALRDSARLGAPMKPGELAERLSQYLGHPPQLPYITRVVEAAFPEYLLRREAGHRLLVDRINEPCLIELIWSYWHEEGMLMQTINAINQRFQNIRRPGDRDPLVNMAIDPLRPLNNLMWGFAQDELNRLSVARRAAEYENLYGFRLRGRAVSGLQVADTRSKFLEAFNNLLYQSSVFFKEDFQTTIIADGFPVLNALREVHLILAQGAHNQFGDLPWTSRIEMLMEMWLLARPEIREFRDLGVFGEQLLLSIRYDNWSVYNDANIAASWARYWRQEIQRYIHSYRAVTGVDLAQEPVNATMPAVLLQRR